MIAEIFEYGEEEKLSAYELLIKKVCIISWVRSCISPGLIIKELTVEHIPWFIIVTRKNLQGIRIPCFYRTSCMKEANDLFSKSISFPSMNTLECFSCLMSLVPNIFTLQYRESLYCYISITIQHFRLYHCPLRLLRVINRWFLPDTPLHSTHKQYMFMFHRFCAFW